MDLLDSTSDDAVVADNHVFRGMIFPTMRDMLSYLDTQQQTMSPSEFRELGTEMTVSLVDDMIRRDDIYLEYMNYWQSKILDWNIFLKSSEYRSAWKTVDDRAKNAINNAKGQVSAVKTVKRRWGEGGSALLELNNANQYTRKLGSLSKVMSYEDFIRHLNHVVFTRIMKGGKGTSKDPTPSVTDFVRVGDQRLTQVDDITDDKAESAGLTKDRHGRLMCMVSGPGRILYSLPPTPRKDGTVKQTSTGDERDGEGESLIETETGPVPAPAPDSPNHGTADGGNGQVGQQQQLSSETEAVTDSTQEAVFAAPFLAGLPDGNWLMKDGRVGRQQPSSETEADGDRQMKNLSLSDQPRTQENQPGDAEAGGGFSSCTTVQDENGRPPIPMPDTLSGPPSQHSSIPMEGASTDPQKLGRKVHFTATEPNREADTNSSTLDGLLSQHSLTMESVSENLKELLRKVYHTTTTATTATVGKAASTTSGPAGQEEEVCQCEDIFDAAGLYEKEVEVMSEMHPKGKIPVAKTDKLLRLLAPHLESQPSLCLAHLQVLAFHLGLKKVHQKQTVVRQIKLIADEPKHMGGWPITRDGLWKWFRGASEPLTKINKLLPNRYKSVQTLEMQPGSFEPPAILRDFETRLGMPNLSSLLELNGFVDIKGLFDWWFEPVGGDGGRSLANMAVEEQGIYQHHTGREALDKDGWTWLQHYSIFQQVLVQDPIIYILNACLRRDGNTRLIWYPEPSRVATSKESPTLLQFGLHLDRSADMMDSSDHLYGMVSLIDETNDGCDLLVPGMHNVVKTWLSSRTSKQDHSELPPSSILTTDLRNFPGGSGGKSLSSVAMPLGAGMYRLIDPRIPTGSQGLRVRSVLLPTLIGINRKTGNLVPGRLGDVDDHVAELNELSIPQHSLRPLHLNPALLDWRKPLFSFLLTGLGALGSAIIGQKSWESVDVLAERNVYLGADREAAWSAIVQWRCMAQIEARYQFAKLCYIEQHLFGAKSYRTAHLAEAAGEKVNIPSDDEFDYISPQMQTQYKRSSGRKNDDGNKDRKKNKNSKEDSQEDSDDEQNGNENSNDENKDSDEESSSEEDSDDEEMKDADEKDGDYSDDENMMDTK